MIKSGNKEAKNKVAEHNIKLILNQISTRFKSVPCEKDELLLAGSLGLSKAINTYDITKNVKFSTYATRCINNEISKCVTKMYKDKDITYIEEFMLDTKKDNSLSYKETISSDFNLEEEYEKQELSSIINDKLDELDVRDRNILTMYFGFNNTKIATMQEIADKLCISRSYVAKIMKKNLQDLKIYLVKRGVINREELFDSSRQFYLPKEKRKGKIT